MTDMLTRLMMLTALVMPGAGCGSGLDVGSGAAGLGGIDVYEKQFSWEEPELCETFLHRRVYDERAHVVSYEAELTITYTVDEGAALPLGVEIYGDDGPLLSLHASENTLEVRGADDALALRVANYTEGTGDVTERATTPIDPASLSLLSCTLPMRTELGYVPGFVRNLRDAAAPGTNGVTGTSAETTPLLPWTGELSLLGAWVRQGMCLHSAGDGAVDWNCTCFEIANPVAGVVRGHCP